MTRIGKYIGGCALALVLLLPGRAFAQCEAPSSAPAAAAAVLTLQTAGVTAMTSALEVSAAADATAATTTLMTALQGMDNTLIAELDWWWTQWDTALRQMTVQLHSSLIDQTRQLAGFNDSADVSAAALAIQKDKIAAQKVYQSTDEACRFDTAAKYLSHGKEVSRAMTTGYALDFNTIGDNNKDSASGGGPAALQRARWQVYQENFCDKDNNNGADGCTASDALANLDVLPGKLIFSKETIDTSNPDTLDALTQLMFNITGYQSPALILPRALKGAVGEQQQQEDREYIAQMDAVGALAYSVVADRIPGLPAPLIQLDRQSMGASDASPTPSVREVRQSIIEQLWDPNYYKNLYGSPATIAQKELYLKAYGLVMLYDMIGKQEKISNVYAIETANMLNQYDRSRHSASASSPLSPGGP